MLGWIFNCGGAVGVGFHLSCEFSYAYGVVDSFFHNIR